MKCKFVIILLLFSKIISSQIDSSKAVVYFKQKDAIVYLDGKKIESKKELRKMAVGVHYIKAWAPKHELFTDSFLVKKKENKFYTKKLVYTDDYKSYMAKKRTRIFTYTIPAILAIGFASSYYKSYLDIDKKIIQTYKDAKDLEAAYNSSFSPAEFSTNYDNYTKKVDDYKALQNKQQQRKIQGIIISSTLAATAITVFVIQSVRKKIPFKETPLLAKMTPGFNPLNKQVCVTVNLY